MEDKDIIQPQPGIFPEPEEDFSQEIPEVMPTLDISADLPEELLSGESVQPEEPEAEIWDEPAGTTPAEVGDESADPFQTPAPVALWEDSPSGDVAEAVPEYTESGDVPEFVPEDAESGDVAEATPDVPPEEDNIVALLSAISFAAEEEAPASLPEDAVPAEEAPVFLPDATFDEAISPETQEGSPMQESEEPEPISRPTRPVRKGRPRKKNKDDFLGIPQLLTTFVWLAIILVIGVSLGRMLWVCAADVLAFGREEKEVVVTIQNDDTIDDIADLLQQKGLIRYSGLFRLYASLAVDDGEIAPGTYTLNTILDYHALVKQMSPSSASRAVVRDVLIPEGYNCRQIFELLEQNGICTVEALEDYAANGEFQDFWFLQGVERGDRYCLEGFLFPDTYDFYSNSTPREALGKLLLGFEHRFTEELYAKLPALNERLSSMMRSNGCSEDYIASHQLSLRELLTVASLIEEETAGSSESPMIASVIYNRLTQDQEYERYLNIDAAIIYATGDAEHIDTSVDSPYNTYLHAGLTPGPISNPGLDSINAALEFADTDYYYYVLNPSTGEHQFSKTYEEHQEWIEKFRGMEPTEG